MMPLFCCPRTPKIERSLVHREPSWFWFLWGLFSPTFGINLSVFGDLRLRLRWLGDGGGEAPGPGV